MALRGMNGCLMLVVQLFIARSNPNRDGDLLDWFAQSNLALLCNDNLSLLCNDNLALLCNDNLALLCNGNESRYLGLLD